MTKSSSYRWLLRALLLALLILLGPYLVSRIAAPSNRVRLFEAIEVPAGSNNGAIKLVAFNIAHGRGATDDNWAQDGAEKSDRVARIADWLLTTEADVVVLNEVDFNSSWSGGQNQAAAIGERAGYRYRVEQRNLDFRILHRRWNFGNAILSKFPIRDAVAVNFPPAKGWEDWLVGCKRGVVAEITPPDDDPLRLLAVHLEHRTEVIRVASAKRIVHLANDSTIPMVAAGDFNSTPTGFPASRKTADGENTIDLLKESERFQFHPATSPKPAEWTFSSYDPRSTIDWILLPKEWECEQYQAVDLDLSDHRPVITKWRSVRRGKLR